MARIGILCPPVPGHINPMVVLARELAARGHSVLFIGFPDMRAALPDDIEFASMGDEQFPPGMLKPFIDRLSQLGGTDSIRELIADLANVSAAFFRYFPGALQRVRPDALVIDQTEFAACLVARAAGVSFANVANALPFNSEPGVPPPQSPWPYDPRPAAIQRNIAAYQAIEALEQPQFKVIRENAKRLGLGEVRKFDDTWSELCQISQCIRGLDFPRQQLPSCFHYVGPFREPEPPLDFELPDDGRPLIFCSLGSLQGSRAEMFQTVCAAVAGLDVHLLLAHGGRLSESEGAALPGKPMLHAFVPQRAVLSRSALAITHAGFNTVMDALSCGTPMLALPIAFEQPGIAARVRRAGAGEALFQERTAPRVKAAIQHILARPVYKANARRLGNEIAQSGGVKRAAALIEQAFGLGSRAAVVESAAE